MTDSPPPYPGINGYAGYAAQGAPGASVGFMNGATGFMPPQQHTGKRDILFNIDIYFNSSNKNSSFAIFNIIERVIKCLLLMRSSFLL